MFQGSLRVTLRARCELCLEGWAEEAEEDPRAGTGTNVAGSSSSTSSTTTSTSGDGAGGGRGRGSEAYRLMVGGLEAELSSTDAGPTRFGLHTPRLRLEAAGVGAIDARYGRDRRLVLWDCDLGLLAQHDQEAGAGTSSGGGLPSPGVAGVGFMLRLEREGAGLHGMSPPMATGGPRGGGFTGVAVRCASVGGAPWVYHYPTVVALQDYITGQSQLLEDLDAATELPESPPPAAESGAATLIEWRFAAGSTVRLPVGGLRTPESLDCVVPRGCLILQGGAHGDDHGGEQWRDGAGFWLGLQCDAVRLVHRPELPAADQATLLDAEREPGREGAKRLSMGYASWPTRTETRVDLQGAARCEIEWGPEGLAAAKMVSDEMSILNARLRLRDDLPRKAAVNRAEP